MAHRLYATSQRTLYIIAAEYRWRMALIGARGMEKGNCRLAFYAMPRHAAHMLSPILVKRQRRAAGGGTDAERVRYSREAAEAMTRSPREATRSRRKMPPRPAAAAHCPFISQSALRSLPDVSSVAVGRHVSVYSRTRVVATAAVGTPPA